MATPAQHTVTFVQDPRWWLKLLVIAVLLALPLSVGARFARARRTALAITFLIALVALLAGHYVARISMNEWGALAAIAAELTILFLGVRYVLGMRLLPGSILAFGTTVILMVVETIAAVTHFN